MVLVHLPLALRRGAGLILRESMIGAFCNVEFDLSISALCFYDEL